MSHNRKILPFALSISAWCAYISITAVAADPYQKDQIPEKAYRQMLRARDERLRNDTDESVRKLERIVKDYPNYFLAHYNLGLSYQALNKLDDAMRELVEASKLNESLALHEPTIDNALGSLYLTMGRYPEALAELKSAASPANVRKLDPDSKRKIFNNVGLAYSHLSESCEADIFYELGRRAAQTATEAGESKNLTGTWIVQQWQPLNGKQFLDFDFPSSTGALRIGDRNPEGTYDGDFTICIHVRNVGTRVVRERMTVKGDGSVVILIGRVFEDAGLKWADDQISATESGYTLLGSGLDTRGTRTTLRFEKIL